MSDAPPSGNNPKNPSELAPYHDLFERMLDATFLLDPHFQTILEVNPAAERVLGAAPELIIGRKLEEMARPEERESLAKELRVSMRRHHPRVFESNWSVPEAFAPERRQLVMELLACKLSLSDGAEVLQVIARDISFRREAEQRMQQMMKDLQAANEKLQILSTVDEMTGLYNFRHFKSQVALEHTRCSRYSSPYAIVFCDLDNFKHYNDRNGHPAGDSLLRGIAEILKKACRSSDLPARYGGEEFAVLCPGVNADGAKVLADRIRYMVATTEFPHGSHQPLGHVSCSVGVASYPENGETAEEVLHSADTAMYWSKTHGRDQVTLAQEIPKDAPASPGKGKKAA